MMTMPSMNILVSSCDYDGCIGHTHYVQTPKESRDVIIQNPGFIKHYQVQAE